MIVLWVAVAVAVEIAAARTVGALFKRQERAEFAESDFDAHVALALAVVAEPSDFETWMRVRWGAA